MIANPAMNSWMSQYIYPEKVPDGWANTILRVVKVVLEFYSAML